MKKLICIICLMVLCVSCKEQPPTIKSNSINIIDSIHEFEYKDHEYILFKGFYSGRGETGVVHNPDCKCSKKNNN